MKTIHVLDEVLEINTTLFAINSHVKDYNLCWHINKVLDIELKKQYNAKTAGSFFVCEFGGGSQNPPYLLQGGSQNPPYLLQGGHEIHSGGTCQRDFKSSIQKISNIFRRSAAYLTLSSSFRKLKLIKITDLLHTCITIT